MKTRIVKEAGYWIAAFGFSLSYNSTVERAKQLFPTFAFKQGGENKFLESIMIWLDVTAPRFWWQEADTYRVGTTKQSASTMHTVMKKELTNDDFEYPIHEDILKELNYNIWCYNDLSSSPAKESYFLAIKNILPEGFLQRRIWMMSYKTLQNIYNQRKNHRLPQWKTFFMDVIPNIQHPEFIVKDYDGKSI